MFVYGKVHEVDDDWMEQLERDARFKNCTDTDMLHNVYFSLEDRARSRFENHEAALRSWALFQRGTRRAFSGENRKGRAQDALRTRVQDLN